MKIVLQATVWLCLLVVSLLAQLPVQQFNAEIPDAFGSVTGRVVLAGDQLVFSSDTKPEASFSAARGDILSANSDGNLITIQLRSPIRDASGDRTRLTIRVPDQTATNAVTSWFNRSSSFPQDAPKAVASESRTYQAHHKKVFGGSKGRLLITNTGLAYESIDDVKDSRRWEFRDIKELKLNSPYELEVEPFSGDQYTLGLDGQGMSSGDYQDLVDRVTKARVSPRK
jgi:hypothetical protein